MRWTELPPLDAAPSLPDGIVALSAHVRAPAALARRLSQIGIVADASEAERLLPLLKAGRLRGLATTGPTRARVAPDQLPHFPQARPELVLMAGGNVHQLPHLVLDPVGSEKLRQEPQASGLVVS